MKETIKEVVQIFFDTLNVPYSELQVHETENNIFCTSLKTEDSGILIGPHGKNIESIQHLLRLLCSRKSGERITIHLEINDYMAVKEQKLFKFIQSKIDRVKQSGSTIKLPYFNGYERKKIHSYVANLEDKSIETKSDGVGAERRIFLTCNKPQAAAKKSLSIDIDGDDI